LRASSMRSVAIGAFQAALARQSAVVSDPDVIKSTSADYRGWYSGDALALLRPNSVAEVQAAIRCSAAMGIAVVPQGGNTSMCGASVPTDDGLPWIILSTTGIDRIRSVDTSSGSIVAEAGCTLAAIQTAANSVGRHFGLDFGARDSARLGGVIATNAGGINVVRYGNCRDLVLGLEVVLPNGALWSGLRHLRKDNSGFDLKQLFVGSEGTLGVITAASLKLHPDVRFAQSALVSVASIQDASALGGLAMGMAEGKLSAIELMPAMGVAEVCSRILHCRAPLDLGTDWYVLIRLAGQSQVSDSLEQMVTLALDDGLARDAVLSQSTSQESHLWAIRDSFSELHKHLGVSLRFDYSVPLGQIPRLYENLCLAIRRIEPDFIPFAFGHLGDGNLHFSACQPPDGDGDRYLASKPKIEKAANRVVWELGGSISAEHGVGQLHRDELAGQKSSTELDLMRRIKSAIDPQNIFNPGKLLPAKQNSGIEPAPTSS
jgi:FAD/FMN-containing dehydrogenase